MGIDCFKEPTSDHLLKFTFHLKMALSVQSVERRQSFHVDEASVCIYGMKSKFGFRKTKVGGQTTILKTQ